MAGRRIGSVDFVVGMDGTAIPAQARFIGSVAGEVAEAAFEAAFNPDATVWIKSMQTQFRALGERIGREFGGSLSGGALEGVRGLGDRVGGEFSVVGRELKALGGNSREAAADWGELRSMIDATPDSSRRASREFGQLENVIRTTSRTVSTTVRDFDGLRDSTDRASRSADRSSGGWSRLRGVFNRVSSTLRGSLTPAFITSGERGDAFGFKATEIGNAWSSLSHDARQWIIIIAAVAAILQQAAVAAAALAAGATIVLYSIGPLITALVVAIAGFQGMFDEIEKVTEAARPAAEAFQLIGAQLSSLQDLIQGRMFQGLGEPIASLATVVLPALQDSILSVADSVNRSLGNAIARLNRPDILASLNQALSDAGPTFEIIADAAFELLEAILRLGNIATPFVRDFASWLQTILRDFNAFVGSVEGQNAIQEWFQNGVTVLSSFGDLIVKTSKVLNELVTPEALERTTRLFDLLGRAMEPLGQLLDTLGRFDVFGILASLLDGLLRSLAPLLDLLGPILEIMGSKLVTAFQVLGTFIGALLSPLSLLTGAFEIALRVMQPLFDYMQTMSPEFERIADAVQDMADRFYTALAPAIDELVAAFQTLLPTPEEFADIVTNTVIPAVEAFGDFLVGVLVPALSDAIRAFADWIQSLGGVENIRNVLGGIIETVLTFGQGFVNAFNVAIGVIGFFVGAFEELGAKLTFVNESIIQPVIDFFVQQWTNGVTLVTSIFTFLQDTWNAAAAAIQSAYATYIQPVIDLFSTAFTFLYTYVVKPISELIVVAWQTIAALLKVAYDSVIAPTLQVLGAAVTALYNVTIKPIGDLIGKVWEAIGAGFKWLNDSVIQPVAGFIKSKIDDTGRGFQQFYDGFVKPALDGVGNAFRWVYDNVIRPVSSFINDAIRDVGNVISNVFGGIKGRILGAFDGVEAGIRGIFNGIVGVINGMIGSVNSFTGALSAISGVNIGSLGTLPRLASGAIAVRSVIANIGEAGPEAVVPLNRPLSQVDPSVRRLSAFAQGYDVGGGSGVSKSYVFNEGAISVQSPTKDPEQTATAVLDRVALVAGT